MWRNKLGMGDKYERRGWEDSKISTENSKRGMKGRWE